eukprot:gb/GEZN01002990.1/.p1 GENE.gb/GEZN01002990.1/~~gb/GEZN01002990.1/.p1  ORF type:complete len:692 (-),score=37.64 gb/GEZN01002990.1/:233-2086(-)
MRRFGGLAGWVADLEPTTATSRRLGENSFGFDFPLQHREDVGETLYRLAARHVDKHGDYNKAHHPIPMCMAGPGTGKTRLLREYPNLVRCGAKHAKNEEMLKIMEGNVHLIVSFGNNTPFKAQSEPDGEVALARRLAEQYFGTDLPPTILPTLREVLLAIRNTERGIQNQVTVIVLGVDEVQRLLLDLTPSFQETKDIFFARHRRARLREVTTAIGSVLLIPVDGVVFLPMLAGTAYEDTKGAILDGYTVKVIWPRLLPNECARSLLRGAGLPVDDSAVLAAMTDCGGLPRALEYYAEKYLDLHFELDTARRSSKALAIAENRLAERYSQPGSDLIDHVLAAAFSTAPISRCNRVIPNDSTVLTTWGDLETLGCAFWPVDVANQVSELAYPAILLRGYVRGRTSPLAHAALRVLHYDTSRGKWPDWEELVRDFLHLRLVLIARQRLGKVFLSDLLPGALVRGSCLEFAVPTTVPTPTSIDHPFPITLLPNVWPALKGSACVVLNAPGAPFNVWVSLPGKPEILLTVECRHTVGNGRQVSWEEVDDALKKAEDKLAGVQENNRAVLFMSNRSANAECANLHELHGASACLLVMREQLQNVLPMPVRSRHVCRSFDALS